jgi:hypothetical protein
LSNDEDVVRNVTRTVLAAGFMVTAIGAAAGQAPGPRPAVLITEVQAPSVARSPVAVIDRLTSFDGNKDRVISRDELPERMQELVVRGDRNADGALDSDEIRGLVDTATSQRRRVSFRAQPSDGLAGVISDLRLAPEKHARALVLVSAHNQPANVKGPENTDLYKELKALLDAEEYDNFVAAAARLSRGPQFRTISGIVGGVVGR